MDTYAENRTDAQISGTSNTGMTHAEQNLQFLQAAIPSNEKFYLWAYADDGHVIATSCPEAEQALFHHAFCIFDGVEKALSCAVSRKDRPSLIGSPIGMQWAVTFETARKDNLFFVIGPVFYAPPTEAQLREALRPYRDSIENGSWAVELIRRSSEMPVMPYAIFTRYAVMVHNTLTGRQSEVYDLFDVPGAQEENVFVSHEEAAADALTALPASAALVRPAASSADAPLSAPAAVSAIPASSAPPRKRDRTKVYQAEQALLGMVRRGDINYQGALNLSSSLSPGVPVQGREPLRQAKISIIVFTSLVCRAAMEGGLSPEIAYPLGDSYIEAAEDSRDTGELNELSLTMYHDFIYRVHHLHINPDCSPAIQKCCDYIELNLDKKIRISDLANLTGYTEYYLTEKFKKETGVPLFLYIRRAKTERAKMLLTSTDLSVQQIAEKLAFSTQNYFTRCFREDVGCSPAQYRKQGDVIKIS